MPTAWYLVPYEQFAAWKLRPAIHAQTGEIQAVGGDWVSTRVPHTTERYGRALVLVRATEAVLRSLALRYRELSETEAQGVWSPLAPVPARAGAEILFLGRMLRAVPLETLVRDVAGTVSPLLSLWLGVGFGLGFRVPRGLCAWLAQHDIVPGCVLEQLAKAFFDSHGAFPTTGVLDAFTGTNGTDLPVYSANWTTIDSYNTLEIQGNAATATVNENDNGNYWDIATFGPNSEVFLTMSTKPVNGLDVALLSRMVGVAGPVFDGYGLDFYAQAANDEAGVYSVTNGIWTLIGAVDSSTEWAAGDGVGLEVTGANPASLQMYRNTGTWAAFGTARSNSDYDDAGNIGLYTASTTARMDDFGGGTVVAGGVTGPPVGSFLRLGIGR
jgi:hypothetical protein